MFFEVWEEAIWAKNEEKVFTDERFMNTYERFLNTFVNAFCSHLLTVTTVDHWHAQANIGASSHVLWLSA
jgi:hypothetical protein